MSEKKQNFLQGTAMLTLATAVVKLIGALYKIPLNSIIGEQGFGYFNTAYEIYDVLLMISTAGLPVAMSRMISQASSLHHYDQVRRIYSTARTIFLLLGVTGTLLMTTLCRQLAQFQNQPDAWAAIGCLGPCVLLIGMMSAYRGYFQGQGNMQPTSVSQVIEAIVKLLVGTSAAILLIRSTGSVALSAGGAILGVTVSCLVSCVYLAVRFHRSFRALPHTGEATDSFAQTARGLLVIAVPITIGSAGLQILTTLETKIYMGRLLSSGLTQAQADTMRGIYGMTQTIFNMPCSLITPITISLIPAITSQLTLMNTREARQTEETGARVTGIVAMPCAVGLAVLAEPITAMLGGYSGEKLELAVQLMRWLGVTVVFNSVVLVTTSIMQAHGHAVRPVINMLIGGVVKLAVIYVLTGNSDIGIVGTPIGTLCCYVVISLLNLVSIRQLIDDPPAIVRNVARSLLSSLAMGVAVYAVYALLQAAGLHARAVQCVISIGAGVVVYVFAAVRLRAITREDCMLLPKGARIAKLLHL